MHKCINKNSVILVNITENHTKCCIHTGIMKIENLDCTGCKALKLDENKRFARYYCGYKELPEKDRKKLYNTNYKGIWTADENCPLEKGPNYVENFK